MKIAQVSDVAYRYASRDPQAVGGAERYQWLLARALAAYGWSSVIGVQSALRPGARARIDGVDFVGIGEGPYWAALYKFFASERPDWCFWFGSTHWLGPAAALGALTGTRTLLSAQFDLDVLPRKALTERERWWWLYALGLALSGKIFVQHRNQYAQLPGRWRAKSHVIPGVVAVPDTVEPHALRRPYVAWVGVLRQPKRPDRVVEIARACPTTEFVICGGVSDHRSPPGYGARMIEKFASVPNITYLGHVSPDRAIEVISGAALLVSTSEAEGFPSVFVEAWAHGTPVVTMEIDPDCVIERHGLGTTADSVEAAAAAITELVASAETRQAMARRARDYVSRTHAGPAVASLVAQALRSASAPTLRPFERAAKSRVFGNRSAGVASAEP